jgi:hypothetical protein
MLGLSFAEFEPEANDAKDFPFRPALGVNALWPARCAVVCILRTLPCTVSSPRVDGASREKATGPVQVSQCHPSRFLTGDRAGSRPSIYIREMEGWTVPPIGCVSRGS